MAWRLWKYKWSEKGGKNADSKSFICGPPVSEIKRLRSASDALFRNAVGEEPASPWTCVLRAPAGLCWRTEAASDGVAPGRRWGSRRPAFLLLWKWAGGRVRCSRSWAPPSCLCTLRWGRRVLALPFTTCLLLSANSKGCGQAWMRARSPALPFPSLSSLSSFRSCRRGPQDRSPQEDSVSPLLALAAGFAGPSPAVASHLSPSRPAAAGPSQGAGGEWAGRAGQPCVASHRPGPALGAGAARRPRSLQVCGSWLWVRRASPTGAGMGLAGPLASSPLGPRLRSPSAVVRAGEGCPAHACLSAPAGISASASFSAYCSWWKMPSEQALCFLILGCIPCACVFCRTLGILLLSVFKIAFKYDLLVVVLNQCLWSYRCSISAYIHLLVSTSALIAAQHTKYLCPTAELCRNRREKHGSCYVLIRYHVCITLVEFLEFLLNLLYLMKFCLPCNAILRPNSYFWCVLFLFTAAICTSCGPLSKHVDRQTSWKPITSIIFFLFRWQSKQNQWEEREKNGFSETPWYHRIYCKYWCVPCSCLLFGSGVVEVEKESVAQNWKHEVNTGCSLDLSQQGLLQISMCRES